ncbi:Ig-like domain-containing protein [Thiothrix lacustris]|uniref:Ig-like domain-containing protein n=1 Tax=Thiothrix lacustris TaxID=525917 RepID=A0ABY9MVY7_9GAMM|nr:Ig-like domain-containing protein [Thiothrix lacustris]WML92445.1 Ig-like domain-containing protein [Thiothrix lacustris]
MKLSERRANAVRDFMIKNGFSGSELLAQGLGESQPKYPNTEVEGHKNRRVDIEYVTYQNEYKDEVIEQGGTSKTDPKVVWRKELIPEPPLWVRQALRNVIDHKQTVDTYTTKASSSTNGGATTSNVPVAVNDTATTTTGTPVSIDVLANDTDPNRDVLIISTFNQGVNGSVTKVGNSLVYTSVPGFTGTDTFSYVIVDPAGNKSTAMVTVTVGAPSPNAPVVRSDTVTTISGTPVRIAVLDNDSDPNGDTLSVAGFSTSSNGTVLQEGNVLIYTPRTGFVGTDTFTYTAIDPAGNRNNATVSITVTAATPNLPVANVDQVETLQNAPVTITVLGNDTDPNGDTLSLTAVGSAAHGTVTRSGNTVIYTPNAGFTGEDQFTYTVSDGNGNNATANVFVKINAPGGNLKAVSDLYTVDMNSSANIFNVTNNDEFPTTGVTVSIVGVPSHGSASISGNTMVYTPNANFSGVDKLTYRLTDSRGGTAETTVDITVSGTATSANLAPVDDYLLIDLNDTVTRSLPVLANDAGDGLTIVAVSTPRYGSASIASDGLSIRYTLRNGYCTDHSFTYIVKDKYGNQAQATVVIDVSPANVKDPNSPPG